MKKHDWGRIRTEYVTGNIGQRALAQKYGVSASRLAQVASNEGWQKQREDYRSKVGAKAEQKMAERESALIVDQLENIKTAGDGLAALIADALRDPKNVQQPGRGKKLDTRAVKNLTSALNDVLNVLRDVYEMPNAIDRARMKNDEGPREIVVRMNGDELEEYGE